MTAAMHIVKFMCKNTYHIKYIQIGSYQNTVAVDEGEERSLSKIAMIIFPLVQGFGTAPIYKQHHV